MALRILLAGMVAGQPHQGGATSAVLQYLLGLRQLGHDVLLVEPIDSPPTAEVVAYFRSLGSLTGEGALLTAGSRNSVGLPYPRIREFARHADLLINISGMLTDEELIGAIPRRLFLDLDPGFNQVWHASGHDMGLGEHTHFASVGQALGSEGCPVPTCDRKWIPTLPPVVLARWPVTACPAGAPFTSVGHWRSYGSLDFDGVQYGQRAHSFRKLISLPQRTRADLRFALGIHPDETHDLGALFEYGWSLIDPLVVAGSPLAYAEFIRSSRAELGIAKLGYVSSRCGWFSDRSAAYLASARPVVAQETGFGNFLPTGVGLLSFVDTDGAAAAIEEVDSAWQRHSRAARAIAEEHLDSSIVLPQLLEAVG